MKIVFFGTPVFASQILGKIIDHGIEIVGIVTKPDKAQGRSKQLIPSPVKKIAEERLSGVPLFQPEKISQPEYYEKLASLKADLFVVVAYGEIIKQPLLEMAPLGCVNVHGSLLPSYRGAAPVEYALLDGAKITGVSIMYLVKKMDAGPVIATGELPVGENTTALELLSALCDIGGDLLLDVLDQFAVEGPLFSKEQDESLVTYAHKITPEIGEIYWKNSAERIHNQVRALTPKCCAWCRVVYRGEIRKVKIGSSRCVDRSWGDPGHLEVLEGRLFISCGSGSLEILEIQLEGKRMMSSVDFLRGVCVDQLFFKNSFEKGNS